MQDFGALNITGNAQRTCHTRATERELDVLHEEVLGRPADDKVHRNGATSIWTSHHTPFPTHTGMTRIYNTV